VGVPGVDNIARRSKGGQRKTGQRGSGPSGELSMSSDHLLMSRGYEWESDGGEATTQRPLKGLAYL